MTDTSKEAVELKPCPFCGGEPSLSKSYNEYDEGAYLSYRCKSCGASTRELYARETCPVFYGQVRDVWNDRRGIATQLQAARDEALEEAAEVATARAEFWLKEHKGSTPYSDASGTAIAKNGEAHDIAFNIRALKSPSAEGDG